MQPTEQQAEIVHLASVRAWGLFLPAYAEFDICDPAMLRALHQHMRSAYESVCCIPPTEYTRRYAENIQRRVSALEACLRGDMKELRRLLHTACCNKTASSDGMDVLSTETVEQARAAVAHIVGMQPGLEKYLAATEVESIAGLQLPVHPCPSCDGGKLHFIGRHRLPGHRLSMGGMAICDGCGTYRSTQLIVERHD